MNEVCSLPVGARRPQESVKKYVLSHSRSARIGMLAYLTSTPGLLNRMYWHSSYLLIDLVSILASSFYLTCAQETRYNVVRKPTISFTLRRDKRGKTVHCCNSVYWLILTTVESLQTESASAEPY